MSLAHFDWFEILKKSQNDYRNTLLKEIGTPHENKLRNINLEVRLRSVEERLRSLEQTVWTIENESDAAWERCTQTATQCSCEPSIKRITCWRKRLNFLPANQRVPKDVQAM